MKTKVLYISILAVLTLTFTSCPEGAMSEGFTDDKCEHDYAQTSWQCENTDSTILLHFTACNIWEVTYNQQSLAGYYTIKNDTIHGGVTDGNDSIKISCFAKGQSFTGSITNNGQTLNINNVVFKRK